MNSLIESEVSEITEQNQSISVNTPQDLAKATAVIKGIKSLMDKVKDSYDPIVDQAHKAHKEAIAQRDKYLKPLQETEKKYKAAILVYGQRVEAAQKELERVTNLELVRIAEEKKAELLKKAEAANDWDAECLADAAAEIKPLTVDVPKKVIEQEGLSIRKTWKARIVNLSLIPKEYWLVNESLLNAHAKDEEIRKRGIGGVEFYQEASAQIR